MRSLPLLDIKRFRSSPRGFAEELRSCCHHLGFFRIKHDVPLSLVSRTQDLARQFFALPHAAKSQIDYSHSAQFRGYMRTGVENTAGKPDLREQVEIAPDQAPDAPDVLPPYLRLKGRNLWPDADLPELRPCVEEYAEHMGALSEELTDALSLALGLERDGLREFFEPTPHWQLKLASYECATDPTGASPGKAGAAEEAEIGVGAHTDSGFLTLLLQDDAGGLQAFTRGAWTDVPPAGNDVLVCNLGEVAELLSGGYLLATPHRVLLPHSQRLSIPYFHNPVLDACIEPLTLPSALEWERDKSYDEKAHWRRPSNAMLAEYGSNAFKSLARSHPAVFEEHHPDLRVLNDGRIVERPWAYELKPLGMPR